jgi:hypothetical protein
VTKSNREFHQPCTLSADWYWANSVLLINSAQQLSSSEAIIAATSDIDFFRFGARRFIQPFRVFLGMAAVVVKEGLQGVLSLLHNFSISGMSAHRIISPIEKDPMSVGPFDHTYMMFLTPSLGSESILPLETLAEAC